MKGVTDTKAEKNRMISETEMSGHKKEKSLQGVGTAEYAEEELLHTEHLKLKEVLKDQACQ